MSVFESLMFAVAFATLIAMILIHNNNRPK